MNNPDKGLVLNRFKVQVLTAALHSFTVVATDPQEAAQKVMRGDGGADAGREGPTPIACRVHPMALIEGREPTRQQTLEEFVRGAVQGVPQQPQNGHDPTQVGSALITVVDK